MGKLGCLIMRSDFHTQVKRIRKLTINRKESRDMSKKQELFLNSKILKLITQKLRRNESISWRLHKYSKER